MYCSYRCEVFFLKLGIFKKTISLSLVKVRKWLLGRGTRGGQKINEAGMGNGEDACVGEAALKQVWTE